MAKKITHVGGIVGAGSLITKELRKRGYDANAYVTAPSRFFDLRVVSKQKLYLELLTSDVVHFHGRWKEAPFLISPKKIVWHYHGDELRESRKMIPHERGALFLASTPDLVAGGYFYDKKPDEIKGKVKLFPNPIDTESFKPIAPPRNEVPLLLHSPENSNRILQKGTATIEKYLGELKERGYKFEYKTYDVKHTEMPNLFSKADIILDQVISGTAGHVGFEAIAMGKPVMCEIRWTKEWLHNEDLFFGLKDIPDLLVDEKYRFSKAKRGIEYVSKYHAPEVVVDRLLDEYRSAKLID
ncbi:MAG: hypothetical protein ACREBS_03295 [Nitrososphaerales archaeon]